MNVKKLKWLVYRFNVNFQKVETYNVLGGKYFLEEIKKIMKKCRDKDRSEFSEALRREMMYHFWGRCEWELIIEITEANRIFLIPWAGCSEPDEVKIDVTDDISFDWRGFAEQHIAQQRYKTKAKIDVFDQLNYRWEEYVDYVLNSGIYRPRKKKTE
jgi:hypothetical protein